MPLTKDNITNQGWVYDNGAYLKKNFLLKKEDSEILIIRKEGDYPTVFAGLIESEEEFIRTLENLNI